MTIDGPSPQANGPWRSCAPVTRALGRRESRENRRFTFFRHTVDRAVDADEIDERRRANYTYLLILSLRPCA